MRSFARSLSRCAALSRVCHAPPQLRSQRFLIPCGRSGTLSVFAVHGKTATAAGTVTTETGARTAALDPTSGRIYLPAAKYQPAAQGQRPAMAPGSAHLLVLAPN